MSKSVLRLPFLQSINRKSIESKKLGCKIACDLVSFFYKLKFCLNYFKKTGLRFCQKMIRAVSDACIKMGLLVI